MHPDHSERKPRKESAFVGLWSRILDEFRNAQRRQADLLHASERRLMVYAEPARGDSGQAGKLRGHSTLLGAEGYPQNQRAIEEPWVRCFRTGTSRIRADRVFPYRRRRLFALLRRPYTKIDISRQQSLNIPTHGSHEWGTRAGAAVVGLQL